LLGLVVAQAVNSPCDFNQKMVLQRLVSVSSVFSSLARTARRRPAARVAEAAE